MMRKAAHSFLLAGLVSAAVAGSAGADAGSASGVAGMAPAEDSWAVMASSSLKTTLEGWARSEGWNVVWDNPVDYRIRASATFYGGFEEAVGRLVDAIHQNNPGLSVTLYRGNRVVHVADMPLSSN